MDETAHIDYAYQIWRGHLPVFEQGILFRPTRPALIPPVQLESQHPPLFYALVAPVAGTLIDARHWVTATMAVRLVNCLISALSVVAIGWAAGAAAGRDRERWMILTAAAATTIGAIVFVGGSAYSDPLLTLMSALAVGVAMKAVHHGVGRGILALAALIAAAGSLARAEFVIALLVLAVGLAVAGWLHSAGSHIRRLERALASGVLPILAAILASGWFYLRNKRLTGSFAGGHPDWAAAHLRRFERSPWEVLQIGDFWNTQFSVLRHPLDGRSLRHHAQHVIDTDLMKPLFVALLLLGVLAVVRGLRRDVRRREWPRLAAVALLSLLTIATFGYEVWYTTGGGGSVSRYLLPAAVPICLVIAAGLQAVPRRFQPAVLAVYLLTCYSMFAFWLIVTPHTGGTFGTGLSHYPWALALGTLPLVAICAVVQVRALSRIQDRTAVRSA
jgi:hypothetical protein